VSGSRLLTPPLRKDLLDENVLEAATAEYRQIERGETEEQEFVTD
jgi:hypothetical protein